MSFFIVHDLELVRVLMLLQLLGVKDLQVRGDHLRLLHLLLHLDQVEFELLDQLADRFFILQLDIGNPLVVSLLQLEPLLLKLKVRVAFQS